MAVPCKPDKPSSVDVLPASDVTEPFSVSAFVCSAVIWVGRPCRELIEL
jgi:hypothetical protein